MDPSLGLVILNPHEARTVASVVDRFFPADDDSPGATGIGVVTYLDRALAGAYADHVETYRLGLLALDQVALARWGVGFADAGAELQDDLLSSLEHGEVAGWRVPA